MLSRMVLYFVFIHNRRYFLKEKLNSVIEENNEKAYGYVSLFKNWKLTIRTVCVTIAFTASAFVYYQLTLNIGNLGGKKL